VLFGRLVREKRGIEGLSQDALAEKSGLTKARISDIETGKIANPKARTVDALCVALNISRQERGTCYPAPVPSLPPRLLEKLARRFGHDMPNATEEDLEAFLMAKAEEFRAMRERLEKMAETEGRISQLIKAANAALGEGDFQTADNLLSQAEAVQLQSGTVPALKKQAELRIERGNWCRTKNALGGVSVRLSQFDVPESAMSHLSDAKAHYEGVRAVTSEEVLPKMFATAGLDLAMVYSDRRLAKSDADYETNLQFALSLQFSALRFFSKVDEPTTWGIVQHNLGCSYIDLSTIRTDKAKSAADIENAIYHLELSFEVRDPDNSLYWVASCRSLGEALLNMSTYSLTNDAAKYVQRAVEILSNAAARISSSEHPHQWAQIQEQLARVHRAQALPC